MNSWLNIFFTFYCVNHISAFYFPICLPGGEIACNEYFLWPNIQLPSFLIKKQERSDWLKEIEAQTQSASKTMLLYFGDFFYAVNAFLNDYVVPLAIETCKRTAGTLPESVTNLFYLIPFLKPVEKPKTDSRLYVLFVVSILVIYMSCYIYFIKKLAQFYQNYLRQEYLENVKRIFQHKQ